MANLVAQHHRLLLDVAEDARVLLAQLDHLDVGEAEPDGIVPDEQLVGAEWRQGLFDRLAVHAQVLEAGAVQRPDAIHLAGGRVGFSVFFQGI